MTTDVDELVERARIAQESADLRAGSSAGGILNKAAGEMVQDISDPTSLVPIYHRITGEQRLVPAWTLDPTSKNNLLLRKDADGKPTFVGKAAQAAAKWQPGKVPCLLSEKNPDRQKYIDMGLGIGHNCPAHSLASVYDQKEHMKRRHRHEWAMIEEAEVKIREDEEREWRRVQMQVAQQALEGKGKSA